MEITLISPTPPDISAFGIRWLSAYLREHGYRPKLIFLPGGIEKQATRKGFVYTYPARLLSQIVELCKSSDLIGISFMTNYFDRAIQLTQVLKERLDIPVLWGGIHPTVRPEQSLEFADMVCIGEGEEALLELMQKIERGESYADTKNIWCKINGGVIRNELRPLVQDLDTITIPDYDLDNHFIYLPGREKISLMNEDILANSLPLMTYFRGNFYKTYRTMTGRGCPHKCLYCVMSTLKSLYPTKGFIRQRSVKHIIDELTYIKTRFPFIQAIQIFDDTFYAAKTSYIKEFSELYREKVGLPFYCQCSPGTISEEKIKSLIRAGMVFTEMGIQSGSSRIKKMYDRTESTEKVIAAAKLINAHKTKLLPPYYHIILDNPWEEAEDLLATLRLLLKIPRPYQLCLSSLVFYPETALYHKALKEGLLKDELEQVYRKSFCHPQTTYLNLLIYLAGQGYIPRFILRILSNRRLVSLLHRGALKPLYRKIYQLNTIILLCAKGIRAVGRGDLGRIVRFFRRIS